jgi:hypothetical protein
VGQCFATRPRTVITLPVTAPRVVRGVRFRLHRGLPGGATFSNQNRDSGPNRPPRTLCAWDHVHIPSRRISPLHAGALQQRTMKRPLFINCLLLIPLACARTRAAEIIEIPLIRTRTVVMSANGNWFAGNIGPSEAAIWSREQGLRSLGALPGAEHIFQYRISADGSAVTGYYSSGPDREPFLWTEKDGMIGLGGLTGAVNGFHAHVSDDGSTVAGSSAFSDGHTEPWIWTPDAGTAKLELPPGGSGLALAITSDGSAVAGNYKNQGFVWDRQTGVQLLPPNTHVDEISGDGKTIVGRQFIGGDVSGGRAFRWTREGGMSLLPRPPDAGSPFRAGPHTRWICPCRRLASSE